MSLKTESHNAPGKCCSLGLCVLPTLNMTHCPQEGKNAPTWGKLQRAEKHLDESLVI